jgi:hypothetical protein
LQSKRGKRLEVRGWRQKAEKNAVLQFCCLAVLRSNDGAPEWLRIKVGGQRWEAREISNVKVQNSNGNME